MINKEEIIYNSNALVSTWLEKEKNVASMFIETYNNGEFKDEYPCTISDCGEILGNILYTNGGKYDKISVFITSKGNKKEIGSVDIK